MHSVTSGRYVVGLATADDDAGLRRLLRETPMQGRARVSLEREPDFFEAARQESLRHDTVVIRDRQTGRLEAMGSRAVRELFVNGQPQRAGYLTQLRIHPERRRYSVHLLRLGFEQLRRAHADDEAAFDFTAIVAGNEVARRILEAGLEGLPRYRRLEEFVSFLLPARSRPGAGRSGIQVAAGSSALVPGILACLERFGRRHQFASRWTAENLLSPESFYVVCAGGRVAGCLALWDQRAYKQVVVHGYERTLERWRRVLNVFGAALPPTGSTLAYAHISHVAIDDDDPRVFAALLAAVTQDAGRAGLDHLAIGFAARHPLAEVVRRSWRTREYASTLYVVQWNPEPPLLDGCIPHPEAAVL